MEKGRHTQSKWGGWGEGVKKFTSINNEPTATQNKSQLKNCTKGQLASPAVSAGEIHVDLLSPAVTVRNYDPPQRGRGGGVGRGARGGEERERRRPQSRKGSVFDRWMLQRLIKEAAHPLSDSEGWPLSSRR